jgi:putative addiction module CopG family antidote
MIILSGLFAAGWPVSAGVAGWKVENSEKIGLYGRRSGKRQPMDQMSVSITDRLAGYVRKKVKSGRYNNASEVVREALRRMEDEDARAVRLAKPTAEPSCLHPRVGSRWETQ